jgi:tRNA dimethylallyltransferase
VSLSLEVADALPCLCIAGPTASGKTALSLALAEAVQTRWPVELISVDSALVYRGMDIGTAKPSAAERARLPHHLIDLLDPTEAYSAARFVADAHRLIAEVHARGHLPLLVGGTMLYFKALFEGLDAMPASDPTVRAALDAEAAARGWPALHAELARVDPVTAARLPPTDAQRIQRALEVFRISGQPLSAFHTRPQKLAAMPPPLLALEPMDRTWLHQRIAERFSGMLAQGLLDEVRSLRARGDLHPGLPSMRCVGYRQAWELLEACGDEPPGAAALAGFIERASAATRQLAKRQLTWLRSMPQRRSIACDTPQALGQALDWLNTAWPPLQARGLRC